MLTLFQDIQHAAAQIVKDHYEVEIAPQQLAVQETRKEFEGDFTLVVFPLAKFRLGAPAQIGEAIGKALQERLAYIKGFNVIKGFVNLSLTDQFWFDFLAEQQDQESFLKRTEGAGTTVSVEYCSPNTNKPLHLGHLRNIVLGYSITQILEANGYEVHPICLFNDRGTAICKSMYAWLQAGKEETPESSGKKGDKLVGDYYVAYAIQHAQEVEALMADGMEKSEADKNTPSAKAVNEMLIKWENGDPEVRALWERMNGWVYEAYNETFKRLGVAFEKFYYESNVYQLGKETVMQGVEQGVFYQKDDGSAWVDLTGDKLDHKLLLRSNGTSVYMTQDIATAELRYGDFKMDKSIYVVGNEQDYHFKVLFLVLKHLGRPYSEGLYHLSYGMVDLPSGKMKSREGTTVEADDLMDEMFEIARKTTTELGKTEGMSEDRLAELYHTLGVGALKYFLIKVEPQKRMLYDPQESVDIHGHTGPFIQSSYTRTASLRQKGAEVAAFTKEVQPELELMDYERVLLRELFQYPTVLKEAADNYNPAAIANYAYELAKEYNRFYQGDRIVQSEYPMTSAFRLALSSFTGKVLKEAMRLLGIQMPERM